MEYNSQDKEVMLTVAKSNRRSRLQELIDFAKISGFKKIGIANCLSVQKYADKLIALLEEQGFEVFAMNCRESGLQGCAINEEMKGSCCDPLSQAEYLNSHETELNIEVGLCLGHGLLFKKYSQAPVTTFLVKDVATAHKTIENLI